VADLAERARAERAILVRGARVHSLADVDVDIPLERFVAFTGVSGSGKTSLAMGVLYAEGSRRYLEGLSTYTRRRLQGAARPDVDVVERCPAALALGQRPPVPGPRSTVGTTSEAGAALRLMFSRLGTHRCPNGHAVPASPLQSVSPERVCPTCGVHYESPSAEHFSFNSLGACPRCDGLGEMREIDPSTIVPDPSLTLAGGAVAPWRGVMRSMMPQVVETLGVRTDVPWSDLDDEERGIVLHGPESKRQIYVQTAGGATVTLNATYVNAYAAVDQIAAEGTGARAERFFHLSVCSACDGTRYAPATLASRLGDRSIAEVTELTLPELRVWAVALPSVLSDELRSVATRLVGEVVGAIDPLVDLGLAHLTLARPGATLSTGERQRLQLARTVHAHTTGLLYVLDEPTVGLHPDNVDALIRSFRRLVEDGNTVIVVDHDVAVLRAADHLVELGPGPGRDGGRIVTEGTPAAVASNPASRIGPFLIAPAPRRVRTQRAGGPGRLRLRVEGFLNLDDVTATFPIGALTAVAGASGAGKTALVLDSLVPALEADDAHRPPQVTELDRGGIREVVAVDATPIGRNARSTVATYGGVLDPLRRRFAAAPSATEAGLSAAAFSYNTPEGRCPTCRGTGELDLDLQYLPDLPMPCPDCGGHRYRPEVVSVTLDGRSVADVLALTVDDALDVFADEPALARPLAALSAVGLGYVTLGEATPGLSGGEAQRLRLATRMRSSVRDALFVFDEPTIGLHPLDVHGLLGVFDRLLDGGATVVVVEHDLDLLANADHVIELGPGAGPDGGRVIATGTPTEVAASPTSVIGRRLASPAGPD
jgi:excinuclease ABC subunit A